MGIEDTRMQDRCNAVCFTGHRIIPREDRETIERALEEAIRDRINEGTDTFYVGGAWGFDMLAQQILMRIREEIPFVQIRMVVPCEGQEENWTLLRQHDYRQMRAAADDVIVLSPTYTKQCMHERNRYMVDHSIYCIAYYTGRAGGTRYTCDYAKSVGIPVQNVADAVWRKHREAWPYPYRDKTDDGSWK